MGYFLGIDLGTTYFKAGLFDENGRLKGLGRAFVSKETGDGTICELPVTVFWNTLFACVGKALENANITPREIRAISYSSQTNSFILLDGSDKPLTPLILWPDKRAKEVNPPIGLLHNKGEFLNKTGLGIEPNLEFSIAKINWFQQKQPQMWKHVNSILSISDYLTFKLTGQRYSDVSTASLTGLLDVTRCQWWEESLELFSLRPRFFSYPQIIGTYAGSLTKEGAQLIGLTPDTSYYMGGLDHHCAAIGSGIPQNNNICESTGTVLSCVSYSHNYSPEASRCVAPGLAPGHYFQMAFDDNGVRSLDWYQKSYAPEYSIPELLDMAGKVKKGCLDLVARPCAYKYKDLDGFYNIRQEHGHGHFVRAILESTASSLHNLLEVVKEPYFKGRIISTGGGAQSSLWVKIKADILKTDFLIPECSETACKGAAMVSALGAGGMDNWDELVKQWVRFKEIIKPDSNNQ